jgi:cAMP-dependent protein kinase regulator
MGTEKDKISEELQDYIRKGAWGKAIGALDRLSVLEPRNPVHRLRRGDYYLKTGDKQRALAAYREAAAGFADDGFVVKALAACKVILRLDPDDAEARRQMLNLHEKACEATGQRRVVATHRPSFQKSATDSPAAGPAGPSPGKEMGPPAASAGFEIERTSHEESIPGPRDGWRPTHALPLFSSLSREEFGEIAGRMIGTVCPAGHWIVKEGDVGDSVYLISRGAVKIVTHIGDREMFLTQLNPNDFFGEVAFLTGTRRTASAITVEETEMLELPGPELRAVVEKHPAVREALEAFYRRRVADTIEKLKNERAVF